MLMSKTVLQKTNALRLLDAAGIAYETREYEVDESDLSGVHAAKSLGVPPETLFKTIVLQGASGEHFVCCIPVAEEIDLKKAARATGEKSCALIHVRELLPLTGYIRGGCSPIGMKKPLPTWIDETAQLFDTIGVSGGRRGLQVLLSPDALAGLIGARFMDLT
jgi:Cys-tRNA(Pro)/Cys-tRNA(Cys) deacylase